MALKNIKIPHLNSKNSLNYIDSDIYIPDIFKNTDVKFPLIIFAHGFKGFKDWGAFPYLCNKLAENGFAVLSFNFTHNGVSAESPVDFTRLDLFEKNTHSIELDDLRSVICYADKLAEIYPVDKNRIGLTGHSRGGGISAVTAYENENIKALCLLASIAKFDRYTDEQKKRWREKGFIEIPNTRTNQMMRLNVNMLDDIEKNKNRLDILKAVTGLKKPLLIIHGREDLAVKFTDAEALYNAADKNLAELHILENTGHTFGVEHPFKTTTIYFNEVIKLIVNFFKEKLA
ncbi:MAG: alpha/beta superfamily hydrolase [Chlorobi bacterium OLB5]|nr:MAG: alpha/beta superfamily hydrolase [Chlorobi bacterium OLB5]